MVSITPLSPGQEDRDYREFFTPEFLTQALGQPGSWQGEGAQHLGLRNPVEASVLRHLLAGLTPDGTQPLVANQAQPERESGWCLDLQVPPSVSVLWALAPEPARQSIEQAHLAAAGVTLLDLEMDLGGLRTGRPRSEEQLPRGVFACFPGRASWDQRPQLSLRAIIPNLGFLGDGTVTGLGSEQLLERRRGLADAYRTLLGGQLQQRIGAFQEWAHTDMRLVGVPSELCAKFCVDPKARHELTDGSGRPATPLRSSELFGAWRRLGDKHGWGGRQAEALLGQMKRQQAWKNIASEWDKTLQRARACSSHAVQAVKRIVTGPGKSSTQPPSTPSRDKDMGHSQ